MFYMNEHSVRKRQAVDGRYTAQKAQNDMHITNNRSRVFRRSGAVCIKIGSKAARHKSDRPGDTLFTPHTYPAALLLMMLSMLCWGSWANTQKIDQAWRFELFYIDYTFGLLAAAALFGLTFGRTDAGSTNTFFVNLHAASNRSIVEAFAGGAIFSIGNILLVAAISVAGMAVAFPVGAGLGLVLGSLLNYVVSPTGNPVLIFGGIALVCIAIGLDALAYRDLEGAGKSSKKGILLSIGGGMGAGLFYPLVAKSLSGPAHLVPYTVNFVFALGALSTALPMSYLLMRKPVNGPQLVLRDYAAGGRRVHAWGVVGGVLWGLGTIANFVASYVPMIGPATSFAMGEGNTMISALWGVFVWKEFKGATPRVKLLLGLMFLFFLLGLTSIALAPIIK
jgi:glucose uptake protein